MTEQIDMINITRRVIRQWFLILMMSIIVALLAGIVAVRRYQPTYQTQAIIAVYGKESYGSVVYDAQDTADVFREIIASNLLQKKVAEAMGKSYLPGSIYSSNIKNTNMITLTAVGNSPQAAMEVMNGVLDHHHVVTSQLLSDMVLQVLEAPAVPTAPIEHFNELKVLVLAFAVSICLLCGILVVIIYLRDDIKNEQQVEKKLDTSLFATVYHEDLDKGFSFFHWKTKKKRKGILVTNPVTSFGYIETFQKMCMKLEYKAKEKGYQSIVVTSVKENEGKSTVSANLALSLAKMGKSVVLLDLDLRKPAMFKLFEIAYDKADVQIGDVLSGNAEVSEATHQVDGMSLYIVAGNRSYRNSVRMLSGEVLKDLFDTIKEDVDYIIIDTPPIDAVADAEEVMRYADAGLLVVRQNGAITKDINDAIDVFRSTKCKLLGCVYNDVETGFVGSRIFKSEGYNYRYGYSRRYKNRYEKRE